MSQWNICVGTQRFVSVTSTEAHTRARARAHIARPNYHTRVLFSIYFVIQASIHRRSFQIFYVGRNISKHFTSVENRLNETQSREDVLRTRSVQMLDFQLTVSISLFIYHFRWFSDSLQIQEKNKMFRLAVRSTNSTAKPKIGNYRWLISL